MENASVIYLLVFKGKWRIYQKRILDNLNSYLNDKKLNIVAAPGAGKTTLGIEVIRRFKNNALILSPTIPIKNQWKTRIVEDFLSEYREYGEFISTDIKDIKDITTTTYQRLQAVFRKGLDVELIKQLKEKNVKTIVLDEAHHLRDEWYKTLKDLISRLSDGETDFKVIALTATPPYDVSEKEWNNYYELCGVIDEEISVPELVKTNDLCPHQDLLYFSNLDEDEKEVVCDFSAKRAEFFNYIKQDEFLHYIENSPLLKSLYQNGDNFYLDMDFTIGLVSYLFQINPNHQDARNILDYLKISKVNIPKFDFETAENFINGLIGKFKEYFNNSELVKNKLKELNLLKNFSKVDFFGNEKYKKVFARSKNKITSIKRITLTEYDILRDKLREVILLDYIGEKSSAGGMNIISTFKALNSLNSPETKFMLNPKNTAYKIFGEDFIRIGILSGSLCVIPKNAKFKLREIAEKYGIKPEKILLTDYDEKYYRVEAYGDTDLVRIVTELFEAGEINVLLGTHALLGEGWDSPCINTLILGSVVESFMLSNQMRGRALRTDKNNLQKTADIWHLLAVENDISTSYDYQKIKRRFETFDGINYAQNIVENGMERLGAEFVNIDTRNIITLNNISSKRARTRDNLFSIWGKCLNTDKKSTKLIQQRRMYQGLKITKTEETFVIGKKIFTINKKLQTQIGLTWVLSAFILGVSPVIFLLFGLPILIIVFIGVFMSISDNNNNSNNLPCLFSGICEIFGIKRTDIILAEALLNTLRQNKYIDDPLNIVKISSKRDMIKLSRANYYLEKIFSAQLLEMFQSPRKITFLVKLKEHNDRIIFLPSGIKTYTDATFFADELEKYFGETEVIDAAKEIDKKELLKARYQNFITSKVQKRRRFQ